MNLKISELKKEFEKLVNDSSALKKGLIINNFSFKIPEEIDNLLDNTHDYIYAFSFYLYLPFSDSEYAYFSASQNLKEPIEENSIKRVVEISIIDNRHPQLMFANPSEAFIAILFIVHPVPPNFSKDLKRCKKYLVDSNKLSNHFALVRLIIKDFMIDFDYYGGVL